MGDTTSKDENFYDNDDDYEIGGGAQPTDDQDVWIVLDKERFVRYIIKPGSEVHLIAQELQDVYNERWNAFQTEDTKMQKPPVILRKCVYTEDFNLYRNEFEDDDNDDEKKDDDDDDFEDDDFEDYFEDSSEKYWNPISAITGLFFKKKSMDMSLPFSNTQEIFHDKMKEKQTDTEYEQSEHTYQGMDFSNTHSPSQKEEMLGESTVLVNHNRRRLKHRRNRQTVSPIVVTSENELVKTCENYFFKKLGRGWDGWYTSEESNLLNIIKWYRTKKLVEPSILDEIKKIYETNVKKKTPFDEEGKVISKLHEKFCHKTRLHQQYFEVCDGFISKTIAIMKNIELGQIRNEHLKNDLEDLNKFAGMYYEQKKKLALDQNQ